MATVVKSSKLALIEQKRENLIMDLGAKGLHTGANEKG
jgi:hypothetical protein